MLSGEEPTPSAIGLSRLEVHNEDDSSHVVEVLVQRSTELLFWDEFHLRASGKNEVVGQCIQKQTWEEPGQYFIRSRLDDHSSWIELNTIPRARKFVYKERGYMNIEIVIRDSGGHHFETYNENYDCDNNHEGPR